MEIIRKMLRRGRRPSDRPGAAARGRVSRETCLRGGVLLTEILLPRTARQGAVCPVSTRG